MAEVDAGVDARAHLVLDHDAVESYVREAKLTVVDAAVFVLGMAAYGVLRVLVEVPYLRAAIGVLLVGSFLAVLVKARLVGGRLGRLALGLLAGLGANLAVLLLLVERNRGTLFAEAAGLLVAVTVTHVVDRILLARA